MNMYMRGHGGGKKLTPNTVSPEPPRMIGQPDGAMHSFPIHPPVTPPSEDIDKLLEAFDHDCSYHNATKAGCSEPNINFDQAKQALTSIMQAKQIEELEWADKTFESELTQLQYSQALRQRIAELKRRQQ